MSRQLHDELGQSLLKNDPRIFRAKVAWAARLLNKHQEEVSTEDLEKSESLLQAADDYWVSRISQHPRWTTDTLNLLAKVQEAKGRPADATESLEKSLEICRQHLDADTKRRLRVMIRLGRLSADDRTQNDAMEYFMEARQLAIEVRETKLLIVSQAELANLYIAIHEEKQHRQSREDARRALLNLLADVQNAEDGQDYSPNEAWSLNYLAKLRFQDWEDGLKKWKIANQRILSGRSHEYADRVAKYNRRVAAYERKIQHSESVNAALAIERDLLAAFQKKIKTEHEAKKDPSVNELEGRLKRELDHMLVRAYRLAERADALLMGSNSELADVVETNLNAIGKKIDDLDVDISIVSPLTSENP